MHLHHLRLIAFGILLVFAVILGSWIEQRWRRFKFQRRTERGRRAERDADEILEREGFSILERQASSLMKYTVDGEEQEAEVRADCIVAKEGVEYIAEIKSGTDAPNLSHAPTRRQLLEYALAFNNTRLLLVDMEAEEIREIEFPALRNFNRIPWRSLLRYLMVAFLVGALAGGFLVHRLLQSSAKRVKVRHLRRPGATLQSRPAVDNFSS